MILRLNPCLAFSSLYRTLFCQRRKNRRRTACLKIQKIAPGIIQENSIQFRLPHAASNPNAFLKDLESPDCVLLYCVFEGFVEFVSAALVVLSRPTKKKNMQPNDDE